jgi:hypothetical protein
MSAAASASGRERSIKGIVSPIYKKKERRKDPVISFDHGQMPPNL